MSFWRFLPPMAAGTIIWMLGLGLIGKAVGSDWPKWKAHLDIVDYLAVALVVGLVAWFVYERVWKARAQANTPEL